MGACGFNVIFPVFWVLISRFLLDDVSDAKVQRVMMIPFYSNLTTFKEMKDCEKRNAWMEYGVMLHSVSTRITMEWDSRRSFKGVVVSKTPGT